MSFDAQGDSNMGSQNGNSQMGNQQVNPRKLFVGNLPYTVTEDQLTQMFAEYGEIVEAKLVINKFDGRSRGIGFVEFATEEEAQKAIEATNGFEIDGRALVVNVARPQAPRENRPRRDFGGGGYNDRRSSGGGFGGGSRGGSSGGYGRSRGGYNDRRGGYDNNN